MTNLEEKIAVIESNIKTINEEMSKSSVKYITFTSELNEKITQNENSLKKQNEILVQKLDAIRHNTALPEVDKINLKERIRQQAYDMALQGVTNFFGNYAGAVKQKFKQNV